MSSKSWKIPLLCGGFALLLRCGAWLTAVFTPLGKIHCVPGLDMETLLKFSCWGQPGATDPLFVPHRMLIAFFARLCGPEGCVPWVLLVQCLCGTLGAVLVSDCARRLWRRDAAGLIAGLTFAAYGPFLLYEVSLLQEALLVNGFVLSFWLLLVLRDREQEPLLPAVLAGLTAGFFTCGRPAGVLFALSLPFAAVALAPAERRRAVGLAAACGLLGMWGVAAGFNHVFSDSWSPFFHVVPYAVAVNTGDPGAAVSAGSLLETLWRMFQRIPLLFSPREYPENLNWYFFRITIPGWKFLLGPGLVLLFGVGSLVWFAASRKCWRQGWIVLLPLVTLAPLLAVREPIGRYRLLLIPYLLILIAGSAALSIPRSGLIRRDLRTRFPDLLAGLAMMALFLAVPTGNSLLRVSDYLSWGIACEADKDFDRAYLAYRTAWEGSGFASNDALIRLLWLEQAQGNVPAMEQALEEGVLAGKADPGLLWYFSAKTALLSGNAEKARFLLDHEPAAIAPEWRSAAADLRRVLPPAQKKTPASH